MLRVCTYNIHKGLSQFGRRLMVHEMREHLHRLDVDLVFLQEVQGLHLRHYFRYSDWPHLPQHEFLAEGAWRQTAYGGNAIYSHGHHGNAILSSHTILATENQDVTDHRFERRGLLHCSILAPGCIMPIHCVCVHLGLIGKSRQRQMEALAQKIETFVPADAPLIIAGDFNDWRNHAQHLLCERLNVVEAFDVATGRPARSFPAALPVFRLDRIYVRGFRISKAYRYFGASWSKLSDHAALVADLELESAA